MFLLAAYFFQLIATEEIGINFRTIDSPISEVLWCGTGIVYTRDDETVEQQQQDDNKKVVFLQSDEGQVYKSTNYGLSWENQNDRLQEDDDELFFDDIQISPSNSHVIFLFGNSGRSFRSINCGKSYETLNHDEEFYDFKLNKMSDKWLLAFKDVSCDKKDINCKESYKRTLYVSGNGGHKWSFALDYVKEASWDKLLEYEEVPDERIIACHINEGKSVISFSDDQFSTSKLLFENAWGYFQTPFYIFILTKTDSEEEGFHLFYALANLDLFNGTQIILPIESYSQHSYTILDTSEGQIFISVSHSEDNQKLTNIYVSDMKGAQFTLSLLNNVRSLDTGNCDFERVLGMDGVYIANIFDHYEVEKMKSRLQSSFEYLEPYKRSQISYDRGGNWHPLMAPKIDSEGNDLNCKGECSLHLKGRTETNYNSIYSNELSPGIALGIGNTGLYLTQKDHEINTYFTRDGGHEWIEIRKGSHIYEIGDRGGLVVMARDDVPTNKAIFSWDQGLTWEEIKFSEEPFLIQNIITEPSNMEQKFIIHGQSTHDDSQLLGYIISLDFAKLHKKTCYGAWDPTMPESDFELWTPVNFEKDKCVFGKKIKYIRRKREAQCFNSKPLDKKLFIEFCECTNEDWECDFGFHRRMEGGPCELMEGMGHVIEPPANCTGTYARTQGYKKVHKSFCDGGVDLGPKHMDCDYVPEVIVMPEESKQQEIQSSSGFSGTLIALVLVLVLIIFLFGSKTILKFWNQTQSIDGNEKRYEELGFVKGEANVEMDEEV